MDRILFIEGTEDKSIHISVAARQQPEPADCGAEPGPEDQIPHSAGDRQEEVRLLKRFVMRTTKEIRLKYKSCKSTNYLIRLINPRNISLKTVKNALTFSRRRSASASEEQNLLGSSQVSCDWRRLVT